MKNIIIVISILINLVMILGFIDRNREREQDLKKLVEFIDGHEFYPLVFTAYNSHRNQTHGDPHITASGRKTSYQTLALSRDLISNFNSPDDNAFDYGDTVTIIMSKTMIVEDTMNKRYRSRGDIWTESKEEARRFGIQKGLLIKCKGE